MGRYVDKILSYNLIIIIIIEVFFLSQSDLYFQIILNSENSFRTKTVT